MAPGTREAPNEVGALSVALSLQYEYGVQEGVEGEWILKPVAVNGWGGGVMVVGMGWEGLVMLRCLDIVWEHRENTRYAMSSSDFNTAPGRSKKGRSAKGNVLTDYTLALWHIIQKV